MRWSRELTEEEERILASIPDCVPRKKPIEPKAQAQVLVLAAHRELSVDGERERVARDLKDLMEAERKRVEERDALSLRKAREFYSAQARVLSEAACLACGEQING
jgi:hypothetical protein